MAHKLPVPVIVVAEEDDQVELIDVNRVWRRKIALETDRLARVEIRSEIRILCQCHGGRGGNSREDRPHRRRCQFGPSRGSQPVEQNHAAQHSEWKEEELLAEFAAEGIFAE